MIFYIFLKKLKMNDTFIFNCTFAKNKFSLWIKKNIDSFNITDDIINLMWNNIYMIYKFNRPAGTYFIYEIKSNKYDDYIILYLDGYYFGNIHASKLVIKKKSYKLSYYIEDLFSC